MHTTPGEFFVGIADPEPYERALVAARRESLLRDWNRNFAYLLADGEVTLVPEPLNNITEDLIVHDFLTEDAGHGIHPDTTGEPIPLRHCGLTSTGRELLDLLTGPNGRSRDDKER